MLIEKEKKEKTLHSGKHTPSSTLPAAGLSFALSPLENHNSITVKRERNVLNTNLQSPIHFYRVNPRDNSVSLGGDGRGINILVKKLDIFA